jgi:hypothetical protein
MLGNSLYMKAIHGGKAEIDKIDAQKIAVLRRGGMLPQAYVYPKGMRESRDLLCRRTFLVRRRAEALVHLRPMRSSNWQIGSRPASPESWPADGRSRAACRRSLGIAARRLLCSWAVSFREKKT